jgi:hypothetical protein
MTTTAMQSCPICGGAILDGVVHWGGPICHGHATAAPAVACPFCDSYRAERDALRAELADSVAACERLGRRRDALLKLLRVVRHHTPLPRGLEDAIDAELAAKGEGK